MSLPPNGWSAELCPHSTGQVRLRHPQKEDPYTTPTSWRPGCRRRRHLRLETTSGQRLQKTLSRFNSGNAVSKMAMPHQNRGSSTRSHFNDLPVAYNRAMKPAGSVTAEPVRLTASVKSAG